VADAAGLLMPRRRLPALALVLTLCWGLVPGSARAASSSARRAQLRERRARLAAQVDALRASDRQLEAAVRALDAQVLASQAQLQAAEQAATAAQQRFEAASSRLAATEQAMARLQQLVVTRAVDAYVDPSRARLSSVLRAADVVQAVRKSTLLDVVQQRDREVLDRVRAAREDHAEATRAARAARDLTVARRAAQRQRVAELTRSRAAQARVRDALDGRIAAFRAEADGLAREEDALVAVVRARQSPPRAARGGAAATAGDARTSSAGLIWPVRGTVTSEYGSRWGRMHEGIDIAAPTGTPIRAAKAGVVIFSGSQGGYGNIVLVDHGGGFVTAYPHQSRIATADGASLSQGQVLGYVGCTGSCTGPHLHFETRVDGAAQNPRRYLP
jgi:murein DD-endopeptidase MepM/ murein hydrolase activator NlpD